MGSVAASGNAQGRIDWVGRGKGGVGKSMMTAAILNCLLEKNEKVFLVDRDTSNPDVWKAHRNHVEAELLDLDEADGWIHLFNTCDAHRESIVVVNTAARNNLAVRQFGATLDRSLDELGARLVALWMINRQRDSLELLKEFMDVVPRGRGARGAQRGLRAESKFELYQQSKVRELVHSRGGKSVTLPDLADRVADDIYRKR